MKKALLILLIVYTSAFFVSHAKAYSEVADHIDSGNSPLRGSLCLTRSTSTPCTVMQAFVPDHTWVPAYLYISIYPNSSATGIIHFTVDRLDAANKPVLENIWNGTIQNSLLTPLVHQWVQLPFNKVIIQGTRYGITGNSTFYFSDSTFPTWTQGSKITDSTSKYGYEDYSFWINEAYNNWFRFSTTSEQIIATSTQFSDLKQPALQILWPDPADVIGNDIFILYPNVYYFHFRRVTPSDFSFFQLAFSTTTYPSIINNQAYNQVQTQASQFEKKGMSDFTSAIAAEEGIQKYFTASLVSPNPDDPGLPPLIYELNFIVTGDGSLKKSATRDPNENTSGNNPITVFHCPIKFAMGWDPCEVITTFFQTISNNIVGVASSTTSGIKNLKPISYGFQISNAVLDGLSDSTYSTTTLDFTLKMPFTEATTTLFEASSTPLIIADQGMWDSVRPYQRWIIYAAFLVYLISIIV